MFSITSLVFRNEMRKERKRAGSSSGTHFRHCSKGIQARDQKSCQSQPVVLSQSEELGGRGESQGVQPNFVWFCF